MNHIIQQRRRVLTIATPILLSALAMLVAVPAAIAQVPPTIAVTSVLKDATGERMNGNFILTYRIYDAETGETALWEESQGVEIEEGILHTVLGSTEPLALPFDTTYWVGVSVNSGDELTPRLPLSAVPYAAMANLVSDSALVAGANVTIERNAANQLVVSAAGDTTATGGFSPWSPGTSSSIYYNSGRVGIGDSSPTATLTVGDGDKVAINGSDGDIVLSDDQGSLRFANVSGSSAPMIEMFQSGTSNATRMLIAHSPTFPGWGIQYNDTSDTFNYIGDNLPTLSVQLGAAKRIGVGTFIPQAKVHVLDNTNPGRGHLKLTETEYDFSRITMDNDIHNAYWDVAARSDTSATNSQLNFYFSGKGDILSVRGDGRVGINDATPLYPLEINGDQRSRVINVYNTLPATTSSTFNYGVRAALSQASNTGFPRLINIFGASTDSDAYISYGVFGRASNASFANYGVYGATETAGGFAGYFSGDVFTTGSYLPSDDKLKVNVRQIDSGLSKIMALNPKSSFYDTGTYTEMNLPEGEQYGFLASEVKAVFPQLVKRSFQPYDEPLSDTPAGQGIEFEAVNYTGMIPVLVSAIKEQQATIDALRQEVAALRQVVNR